MVGPSLEKRWGTEDTADYTTIIEPPKRSASPLHSEEILRSGLEAQHWGEAWPNFGVVRNWGYTLVWSQGFM